MFRRYFNDYLHGPQFSAAGRTDSRGFKIKQKRLNPSTRHQNAAANVPVWAKRMDQQRTALDEVSFVWLHQSVVPIKTDHKLCSVFVIVSLGHEFGHTYGFIELNYKSLGIDGLDLETQIH